MTISFARHIPKMDVLELYHNPLQTKNRNLELRGTIISGKMISRANSVYIIQRQLFARSERVKGIDFHPVEPWILTTLYSGMFLRAWEWSWH